MHFVLRIMLVVAIAGPALMVPVRRAQGEPPVATPPEGETAQPTLPPARTHYLGREIAATMHFRGAPWLVRESRQRQEDCTTLLKALKLKPGLTVCDLGAGNGFYTLKIASMIAPKGRVLAVDVQTQMLQMLRARAKDARLENIEPILGTLADPNLPEGKVDLVLCVDAYHEFSHPVRMLQAIRKSLTPTGRLVLVEFRAEDPKVPIKKLHKMSKKQIVRELEPNGFKLVEQFDELPWQHVMFFERDDEWKP